MTEHTYDDPQADGLARAVQAAAISLTIAEALARLQQERADQRAVDDERAAASLRTDREASHASARVAWTPALNDRWLQRADTTQILGAWVPATVWATSDPDAHEATGRTEQRLAEMHPEAMHRYAQARAEGLDPAAAMGEASPAFAMPQPGDVVQVQQPRAINASTITGQTVPSRTPYPAPARRR